MSIQYKLKTAIRHLFRRRDGERLLKSRYQSIFHSNLNTKNPQTFSEKLFCRMIQLNRDGNANFSRLADKYLVRNYVAEKIGDKYLVKLLWHGSNPENIPFDALPTNCIAKTNHGSGQNIVLKSGFNRGDVVCKLKSWLSDNYYWAQREYQYYEIPPKILIEEFIDDECEDGPLDYRFWCFNGKPEIIQVDNHSHSINPFYDLKWKKLALSFLPKFIDCEIEVPINLTEMIAVASKLSEDIDFVRVDLYNIQGKIYFGEMTFSPMAGNLEFQPEHWDTTLGEKWDFKS